MIPDGTVPICWIHELDFLKFSEKSRQKKGALRHVLLHRHGFFFGSYIWNYDCIIYLLTYPGYIYTYIYIYIFIHIHIHIHISYYIL